MGELICNNIYNVRFSQPHAIVIVNSDGLNDSITGKRSFSHGPKGYIEPLPLKYFMNLFKCWSIKNQSLKLLK